MIELHCRHFNPIDLAKTRRHSDSWFPNAWVLARAVSLVVSLTISLFGSTGFAARTPPATELTKLFANPIAMTLVQVLAFPKGLPNIIDSVNVLPQRGQTPLLEKNHDLRFRAYLQPDLLARLIFVLPGLGATSGSAATLSIAEKLFEQGYHVVTLDNPFSWSFVVAASSSGTPGEPSEDAKDLYRAMGLIKTKLTRTHNIQPKSYSVVGYSLGALQSVFLKRIDDRERKFRFDKVFLINPPVDLLHALNVLDRMSAESARLSDDRKQWVFGRALTYGEMLLSKADLIEQSGPDFLVKVFRDLGFARSDMVYLVSKTFQDSLRDVVFSSQQVFDRGVLKNQATWSYKNARLDEAGRFTFARYLQDILVPAIAKRRKAPVSLSELNSSSSLYQFSSELAKDPRVFLIHSQDDFLLPAASLKWIHSTFGARASVLPFGGHCGTLGLPQFKGALKTMFPPIGRNRL